MLSRLASFSIEEPSAKENFKGMWGNFVFNLSPAIRLGCWCSQLSAMTHIRQICSIFDVANLPSYHAGFAPMLFQWSHSHMQHFFVIKKLHDKKGSRAKKSCNKKIALCVLCHLGYACYFLLCGTKLGVQDLSPSMD